ncbi:DUF4237 domain-containing protein [Mycena sanguinolenta]|uniref:DUF4237 domain-containing protein n=1 Tax=Mycena sanguinolenta TaxID=230812 RepID=A0A8H7CT88_9AGAR|nr:DUF4237 domain-containing protein [Mycena sanguinolenta]
MLLSFVYIATAIVASAIPVVADLASGCNCDGVKPAQPNITFMCGEELLGPAALNKTPPTLFAHYDQLGGLCPEEWLKKYTETKNGTLVYRYPDDDGFQISVDNNRTINGTDLTINGTDLTINGTELLLPGMLVDRFGRPSGKYLAPAYTPVSQRALPPRTLNPGGTYNLYNVSKPFNVSSGTTAAGFGQSGQGTQYHLLNGTTVQWYVEHGYLKEIKYESDL